MAKKTTGSGTGKTSGKAAATAKKSGGTSASKSAAQQPVIDTDLAASAAARMLGARRTLGGESTGSGGHTIEQLKKDSAISQKALDGLFKSTASGGGGHSHLPSSQKNQTVRAQTKGADVSRVSVPRRTAG